MQELVSVIVPVYNVEKYIDKCVESVINQSYSNLEIILVDDGATDESGRKCDVWMKKDERVVVIHKKNEGLSSARNEGLKVSKGTRIIFIDSDDFIDKDMIALLSNNMDKYRAQVSACGYDMVYVDRSVPIIEGNKIQIYDNKSVFDVLLHRNNMGVIACNKLYITSLFNGIEYPYGRHFEDIATTYKVLAKADYIVYEPKVMYHYVQRDDSINGNNFTKRSFNESIYDMKTAADELMKYVKDNNEKYIAPISLGCIDYYIRVINQEIMFDQITNDFVNETRKLGKKFFSVIIGADYISLKKKIQYVIFIYAFKLYKFGVKGIKGRK